MPGWEEFGKFKKDGEERTAFSPAEAVDLQFDGWQPADKKAKDAVDPAKSK